MRSRASFESEALPHLESLLRTAVRLSGERARAEDAVQDTYPGVAFVQHVSARHELSAHCFDSVERPQKGGG
jgi:hypothetical protein